MTLPVFVSETIHHEAIDWATRASANGGIISTNTIRAVSAFCRAIDTAQIRSAMYRVNPFCGGNLSGCLVPLYRGPTFGGTTFGNATDTNVNFVSADFIETGATGGLKFNGTNKYLQLGFASNSLPSSTSVHGSYSATGLATSGTRAVSGSGDGGSGNFVFYDHVSFLGAGRSFRHGSVTTGTFPNLTTPGTAESHIIGTRTAANAAALYRDGSLVASNATSISTASTALGMFVGNYNLNGTPVGGQYTAANLRMYSIGTGLTATQAAAFSAAVIAFNAALGR